MQLKNIEFLKQFRKEELALPCEDTQYRNVQFRHLSGSRKNRRLLERYLEDRITHSGLVGAFIAKIETEDRVVSRRLIAFMEKLAKTFAAYCRRRPGRSGFLSRVGTEIERFTRAATLYEDKAQLVLLN